MKARGVTRIEGPNGGGSGWMVRLTRKGRTRHKWFADGQYGGKTKAFKAAKAYHAELEESSPAPTSMKSRKTSRNKTGKVGVRLAEKVDTRRANEHRYLNYVAFWTTEEGEYRTISFSRKKYGARAAFALAKIARDFETTDRTWVERRFKRQQAA